LGLSTGKEVGVPIGKMGGSEMSLGTLVKKQFTPSKIIFHILFWGLHWGMFAFGW